VRRHGYVAVACGAPGRLSDLPQAARIARASDDERRGLAQEVAALLMAASYTHLRAHVTPEHLVCRPLLDE